VGLEIATESLRDGKRESGAFRAMNFNSSWDSRDAPRRHGRAQSGKTGLYGEDLRTSRDGAVRSIKQKSRV